ncbi:hypothetical protein Dimus_003213 [Dionaea muscipula]
MDVYCTERKNLQPACSQDLQPTLLCSQIYRRPVQALHSMVSIVRQHKEALFFFLGGGATIRGKECTSQHCLIHGQLNTLYSHHIILFSLCKLKKLHIPITNINITLDEVFEKPQKFSLIYPSHHQVGGGVGFSFFFCCLPLFPPQ